MFNQKDSKDSSTLTGFSTKIEVAMTTLGTFAIILSIYVLCSPWLVWSMSIMTLFVSVGILILICIESLKKSHVAKTNSVNNKGNYLAFTMSVVIACMSIVFLYSIYSVLQGTRAPMTSQEFHQILNTSIQ